jgi:hypothetical protein
MTGKYYINIATGYICPTTRMIVTNPNYTKHFDKYAGKKFVGADEPLRICEELKADGTVSWVMNSDTNSQVFINCETQEVDEYNDYDDA